MNKGCLLLKRDTFTEVSLLVDFSVTIWNLNFDTGRLWEAISLDQYITNFMLENNALPKILHFLRTNSTIQNKFSQIALKCIYVKPSNRHLGSLVNKRRGDGDVIFS